MRPTLQTVPENSTATANQTTAPAAVPTTPNGTRGTDPVAEKMTSSSNSGTAASQEKAATTHQPPQAQQLQPVKARNSSRVSITFKAYIFVITFLPVCVSLNCYCPTTYKSVVWDSNELRRALISTASES